MGDAVDSHYIACFICPERFSYRRPQQYPLKTAIVHSTLEIPVRVDSSGNAVYFINPDCPFSSSVAVDGTNFVGNGTTESVDIFNFFCYAPAAGLATN